MSELYIAYAEYLERMLGDSDELAQVIADTVPDDVCIPALQEWAELV